MLDPTDDLPPSTDQPRDAAQPTPPDAAQPTPPEEGGSELTRDSIHKYVWTRYIDYGPAPFALDEEQALVVLERHYKEHSLQQDAECFYYGILAYEFSFAAPPEQRASYLTRALEAFSAYTDQTSGAEWAPVADRYEDARDLLAQPSP